jgi:pimeloyl-ACP methyl ester carboxylesterase
MHSCHDPGLAASQARDQGSQVAAEPPIGWDDAGSVVCLHASASTGRQWRALQSRLSGRHRVFTPDLYGAGDAPPWPGRRGLTLADEVALLEPVFLAAGESFHLVGHSYGGAVALQAALAEPGRVRSLVLIEPVLFGLLLAEDPGQPAVHEILALRDDTGAATQRGALDSAAERFIDYWMGRGTWACTPSPRREAAAQAMPAVSAEWSALFNETTPLRGYSSLRVPTLLVVGSQSPAPARSVTRLLTQTLPDVTTLELDGVGHMAPVTHPGLVNAAIEAHITKSRSRCSA